MTKSQANFMLANTLHQLVEKYPHLRFSQILQNFEFIKVVNVNTVSPTGNEYVDLYWKDEFYLEPQALLERVEEALRERSND